ncbi:prepilin peptidase [Kitasatospora sp. NPDC059571]|uniref:prepilin peptidase n=1 Tax=Kitasatospora sp. NPDC059571 TaxID=3346871 RepID=UPI0036BD7A08
MTTPVIFTAGCTLLGFQVGAFLPALVRRLDPTASGTITRPGCHLPVRHLGCPSWRGWVTTANTCTHCGRRLGPAALPLELHTAAVFGLLAWRLGPSPALPAFLYLGAAGVALAVADLRTRRLPDLLVLPSYPIAALLLGLAAVTADGAGPYLRALTAAALLFSAYAVLAMLGPRNGMGGGDVKLAGVLGMFLGWLGWRAVLNGTVLAFGFASIVAAALLASRRATWSSSIPFGPFMLAGTLAATVLSG